MAKKTVEDIQVAGKRVLCRVDFNVPLTEDMKVADDKRIVAAMPTIQYLLDHKAKVILCSHLGRPKGKVDMKYTMAPVAARLQELLPGVRVQFASDTVGESAQKCVAAMKDGEIVLLENTRFQKEEEANDPEFSRKLAELADIFVSDAFGTVHRAHASTAGVAAYLPAVAGFLIGKELGIMGEALNNPQRPFVAILGGAKVSDKIGVIKNLLEKCDTLLIGGGMAYTFYKAMGYSSSYSRDLFRNSSAFAWPASHSSCGESFFSLSVPSPFSVSCAAGSSTASACCSKSGLFSAAYFSTYR